MPSAPSAGDIVPGVRYKSWDLKRRMDGKTAQQLAFQGYVLRFEPLDDTYTVVPYKQAAGIGNKGTKDVYSGGTFEPLDPIVKRTPQERVDSLMLRWLADCKAAGTVPGLDDEKIREIVGAAWVAGRSEVTAEVVRMVAQHFLTKAEAQAAS